MSESEKHKMYKEIAKNILRKKGIDEADIIEEYPCVIHLREMDIEYFSNREAFEKWGRLKKLYPQHPELIKQIEEMEKYVREGTKEKIKKHLIVKVDVVGITKDGRKIAIECGKNKLKIKPEILRKEFDEVLTVP